MSCIKTVEIALCIGIALACCHTVLADVTAPPPAAYSWLFDEGTGTTTAAYTGGHDGALLGTSWQTLTPFSYDGNHSVNISVGGIQMPGHTVGTSGAFSLWVWTPDFIGGGNQFFIDSDSSTRNFYLFYAGDTVQTKINDVLVDNQLWLSSSNFALSTWHNLVWSWDNSQATKLKIYVDGANVATSTTPVGDPVAIANWFLGSRYSSEMMFNGYMDEVAFWNTPLSAANVAWVSTHSLTAPVPEPGTMTLVIAGLMGLLAYAWRRRN